MILVICGPSGVGKGSFIHYMMSKYPNKFSLSISHTTRKPRTGETHGVDYYFVTKEKFFEKVKNNDFVEYAEYNKNYYGTSKAEMLRCTEQKDKVVILEIEIVGAMEIKRLLGDKAKYIKVIPPSFETLEKRLHKRQTETDEEISERIKWTEQELVKMEEMEFDDTIISDKLESSCVEFDKLIHSYLSN